MTDTVVITESNMALTVNPVGDITTVSVASPGPRGSTGPTPSLSSSIPTMNGVGVAGSSGLASDGAHTHPHDTTYWYAGMWTAGGGMSAVNSGSTAFNTPTLASESNDVVSGTKVSTSSTINTPVGYRTSNFNGRLGTRTECRFRFKFEDIAAVRILIGMVNSGATVPFVGSDTPIGFGGLRFSTNVPDTTIQLVSNMNSSGGTESVADTGITVVSGNMYDVLLVINATTITMTIQQVTTGSTGGVTTGSPVTVSATTGSSVSAGTAVLFYSSIENLTAAAKGIGMYRAHVLHPNAAFTV